MPSDRMRRVDEAVRQVLSDAVAQDLQDPRIGFVTMTSVKTTSDLRHARVYVSVLGDEDERDATMAGLRSAHGALQAQPRQSGLFLQLDAGDLRGPQVLLGQQHRRQVHLLCVVK